MKKHNATVHQRKKAQSNSFECLICKKAFDQKGGLKKYKAAVHEEKKPLKTQPKNRKSKIKHYSREIKDAKWPKIHYKFCPEFSRIF